ncbi:MAG: pilus assembly protein PilM [Myxococcales bacterium]|nr:pilus assembly protein PilM [Myxococcales bacterium]
MSLVLGLEVTGRVVRGAFLRTALRGWEMEQYAEAPLPYSEESDSDPGALQAAITQVLSAGARAPDRIIASLNGEAASLRLIDLPAGVEKKAGEVLPGELGSVLPFDIEDAIVDYQVVGRGESTIQLMAVAAPRRNVAARLNQLRSAGVDPTELAVGAAAFDGLGALLGEPLANKTVIVVDLGPTNTDFAALTNGGCTFARTLSGGMNLVESGRRAELGAALQRTLASYRAQRSEEPSMVLLSGETAPMESARSWLTEQLGLPCGVAPLPEAPGADEETRPKFAKAAALASRAISRRKQLNLRRGEFASAAAASELRTHARLIAACFAAILLSFGVSLLAQYRVASAEQERLTETLAEVSKDLLGEETRSALHARELLTAGARIDDPLPRFDAYDVLEAISESIPADIQHDTRRLLIEIDDDGDNGRFEIQGTVGSIADRDRLLGDLQAHACFAEAEKGSISNAVGDRKDYKLVVKVDCDEAAARPKNKEN